MSAATDPMSFSLFLSIHERTRELGMLRAVGATRRQVRQLIRYESVITAVIGGVLGTMIGVVFAWLTTYALEDLGLGFATPPRSSWRSGCWPWWSGYSVRSSRRAGQHG